MLAWDWDWNWHAWRCDSPPNAPGLAVWDLFTLIAGSAPCSANRPGVRGVPIGMQLRSTPGDISECMLQRLVNFGTVSLARALGNPPDELLTLRCECGARGCSATLEATATEHHDDECCLFMVAHGHEVAVPGRVTVSSERFVKVRVAEPPAAAPTRVEPPRHAVARAALAPRQDRLPRNQDEPG